MTYEDLVNECKRLRAAGERAQAEFLLFLVRVERDHMELLKGNGCTVFAQFLRTHDLCSAVRYERFKAGVQRIGEDQALEIGAYLTIAAGQSQSNDTASKLVEAGEAWRAVNGVAPSEQASKRILRQVEPRREMPQVVRVVNRQAQLEAENRELRAKLRAAEARAAKAEARVKELEAKLAKKKAA